MKILLRPLYLTITCLSLGTHSVKAQLKSGFHCKILKEPTFGAAPDLKYETIVKPKKGTTTRSSEPRTLHVDKLRADIKPQGDTLVIDFWGITNTTEKPDPALGCATCVKSTDLLGDHLDADSTKRSYYYFTTVGKRTRLNTPVTYLSIPYAATEIGVATVPFKYRFGNTSKIVSNQLLSDISAGLYIGRKWGRTRFYADKERNHNSAAFTIGFLLSPTIISIDSTNTRNEVKTKSDEMGITTALATMYSYQDVSVGLFFGADHPVTGRSGRWVYANKPWIGFGLGYKLNMLGGGKE